MKTAREGSEHSLGIYLNPLNFILWLINYMVCELYFNKLLPKKNFKGKWKGGWGKGRKLKKWDNSETEQGNEKESMPPSPAIVKI